MPNWRNFGRNHKKIKGFKYPILGERGYYPAHRPLRIGERTVYFRYIGDELDRLLRLTSSTSTNSAYDRTIRPDGYVFSGERIHNETSPLPDGNDVVEWSHSPFEY